MMKHIPVTLLTGFLGSGKTTLLARALARPEFADSLVIVNEFGEVSIDHLIVADLAENIIELRDGCLCCTIRGDLVMTLRDVYRKRCLDEIPKFARVIVETTGLADPIPLIHTLMANPPLMKVFALDAVIAMVDSVHGSATLQAHDTASKQIAVADILVMSKVDCASPGAIAELRAQVSVINPTAELVLSAHGDIEATCVLERGLFQPALGADPLRRWLHTSPTSEDGHSHDHGSEYGAHVIEHEGPLSLAGTSVFLNRIVNEFSDEIVRIKGLAGFREKGGKPALLHAVQNKFYPVEWLEDWPDSNTHSRFVFIGRGLDIARIDELFSALCV